MPAKRYGVRACDECLRRAWLVGSLSQRIERAATRIAPRGTRELLGLSDERLAAALAGGRGGDYLKHARARDPRALRKAVRGAHCWACCRHDPSHPAVLGDLRDAPAVLFGRGDASLLAELSARPAVTIVGSRRPSAYGREVARELGRSVGAAGLPVVSGMALGIDSCAHEGALDAAGLTVAVLGSGPDLVHPASGRALHQRISDAGLVLGELPPSTAPRRWTFPARNRIMAALGAITIVVEARARSGSLITSGIAEQLGREVGAVPGRVGSSPAVGANSLLRDGAQVIRGGQDVLDSLLGAGAVTLEPREGPAVEPELASALDAVERGAATQDAIARAAGLDAPGAATALTRLELIGLVSSDSAGRYTRTTLDPEGVA
jgi:DNA processing protein